MVAGGRRYRALAMLVSEGKIAADAQVPVRIVDEQESTSASLTENISRESMHPADEFAAFQRLTTGAGMELGGRMAGVRFDRVSQAGPRTPGRGPIASGGTSSVEDTSGSGYVCSRPRGHW